MPLPEPARTDSRRIRLAPDLRIERILESALAEFARHGFAATRIVDIARGAGLSKSGFYAHFESKEDVFEALLTRFLVRGNVVPFEATDSVADFVDRFLDFCYAYVEQPHYRAVLRLLFTEALRIPDLVGRWRAEVGQPVLQAQVEVLNAAIRRGQLAHAPTLEEFALAYTPVVHWVLASDPRLRTKPVTDGALARHRRIHRQIMLALLRGE
ncbi:MAG TPA: TetR/AcrR family transcriptional regulator [Rubrivivax sp.]|nr:TetR/AcrR family transcriptional regulator [Rubrivivax sp.]